MKQLPIRVFFVALFALFSSVACNGADPPDTSDVASYEEQCRLGGLDWELTDYQTVVAFNPRLDTPDPFDGEHPEGLAFHPWKNLLYVSLALTGEVAKVDMNTGEVVKKIPIPFFVPGPCPDALWPAIMGPVTTDLWGNVYLGVGACEEKAIVRIDRHDEVHVIATLPPEAAPNGIALRLGKVYLVDSVLGCVWKANAYGDGSPAEVLTSDQLLAYVPNDDNVPGSNGNQYNPATDELWIANASASAIVAIPFLDRWNSDSPVGAGYVLHDTPVGLDDFAIGPDGTVWGTTDPYQTVLKISPDGTTEVALDASDGLDGPTEAAIRPRFEDGELVWQICVSNADFFLFFDSTGNGPNIGCGRLTPSY